MQLQIRKDSAPRERTHGAGARRSGRGSAAALVGCAIAAAALAAGSTAHAGGDRTHKAELYPTTGFNSDCDQPVFQLPPPLPADQHFDFIGLYDAAVEEDGLLRDALTLSPEDCASGDQRRIATTSNPDFRAFLNFPPPDPRLLNLRSNEVPVIAFPDGSRTFLPPEGTLPPPFPASRSLPSEPQTLAGFRDVKGKMRIKCRSDGTAEVRIKVDGYDPNMLIAVNAIWLTTPPGAPGPIGVPTPFGGVPNILSVDKNGKGTFERELGYCPMDTQPDGSRMLMVNIDEHWDGTTYGVQPDLPLADAKFLLNPTDPSSAFTSPIGAGIVAFNRGAFPVTVEPWE